MFFVVCFFGDPVEIPHETLCSVFFSLSCCHGFYRAFIIALMNHHIILGTTLKFNIGPENLQNSKKESRERLPVASFLGGAQISGIVGLFLDGGFNGFNAFVLSKTLVKIM